MKRRSTSSDRGAVPARGERPRGTVPAGKLRQRVAQEAARLMASGDHGDIEPARRKAAARLGVRDPSDLPDASEIRAALAAHQRLFGREQSGSSLQRLRGAALEAMAFFSAFEPRLAGPVLDGTATASTAVCLHLHASDPDDVARFLHDQRIPASQSRRRIRLARERAIGAPCWEFLADGIAFELVVLPQESLRQAPLDALDGAPLARVGAAALRRLIGPGDAIQPR